MIKFKKIGWKNLLSTGNSFTEVELDTHKTTLITGTNGAGKSTMLDALCFALFDRPFRNLSKTKLINSVNGKDTEVYVEFETGKNDYKVVRGMKPNKLEIYKNGVLQNQESAMKEDQKHLEDHILKMGYKAFTQIDILGSARFTPFMQLPAGDRRNVIEDLLDIQVFSTMNTLAKGRKKDLEQEIYELNADLKALASVIKQLDESIESLEQTSGIKSLGDELKKEQAEYDRLISERQKIEPWIESSKHDPAMLTALDKEIFVDEEFVRSTKLRIEEKKKQFHHYNSNPVCDSCGQSLNAEKVAETKKKLAAEVVKLIEECDERIEIIRVKKIGYNKLKVDDVEYRNMTGVYDELSVMISHAKKSKERLEAEILKHQSPDNQIAKAKAKRDMIKDEMKVMIESLETAKTEKDNIDLALTLLKDSGIKAMLIKQYLPVINKKVNEYLKEMDFFVRFELDENFEEKILSRHLDTFSYENFSEGEKMRIDLALLFTWRHIARMRNSVSSNILILDEVMDSSLDQDGTDEFLNIVQKLAEDSNIMVISHKSTAMVDKFERHLKFNKKNNFSEMQVV